ncbi:hypothetical protein SOVF_152300 [Spinacia oleracea]|nr:hypothetical protein SOVF_152300 [Spinacia oleracea]
MEIQKDQVAFMLATMKCPRKRKRKRSKPQHISYCVSNSPK